MVGKLGREAPLKHEKINYFQIKTQRILIVNENDQIQVLKLLMFGISSPKVFDSFLGSNNNG
jgi:hypothetical protein